VPTGSSHHASTPCAAATAAGQATTRQTHMNANLEAPPQAMSSEQKNTWRASTATEVAAHGTPTV
jgi:hypothetical protein